MKCMEKHWFYRYPVKVDKISMHMHFFEVNGDFEGGWEVNRPTDRRITGLGGAGGVAVWRVGRKGGEGGRE